MEGHRFIGDEHFFSVDLLAKMKEQTGADYLNLILTSTICACLAISAISERYQLQFIVAFVVIITAFVIPLATAWTFAGGFLNKLFLIDKAGCFSIHLPSGVIAFVLSALIGPRLGRYESI